jgi:hypothetical protein
MKTEALAALFSLALCVPIVALGQAPDAPPTAMEPSTQDTATTADAPVPANDPAGSVPVVDAATAAGETGTIVFFREKKFTGAAVRFKVREGDTELGKLGSGTYFTIQVPVGRHEYVVHSEAKDVLALEIEPGETYYVLGSISLGVLAGRPNLSPSSQAAFEAVKGELKDVTGQDIDGASPKGE